MLEQDIEQQLIAKLTDDLKYTYRSDIHDRAALEKNFRTHFETLNRVHLSEAEFSRPMDMIVSGDVYEASCILREPQTLERDDGTPLSFTLVNTRDWCKNSFEVVNQLRINTASSHHRYDVIILLNGIPVVQIELKNLAVSPRRAMKQIVDYKHDPGNGYTRTLLCFIQLFIVSNRSETWYFANNNDRHFSFDADERFLPVYQFADRENNKITALDAFADAFLSKCVLSEMISRYMVLVACEQKLLMMRPYQIYAVQAIMDCIRSNDGNGYIWHTTGSGKTLTSFKASTLLKSNPDIAKCLFVVDRKDLDRQTRQEFNRFQEGCVEENTNTATLVRRLLSTSYADKVIVTTIQKLSLALSGSNRAAYREQLEPLRHQRMVFIFDECHRSQFGDNHQAIRDFFPNAQLFGFTGTPIFEENAYYQQREGQQASYKTTEDIFQRLLHAYTITNAIEDRNVLRFHVDYFRPQGENTPRPGTDEARRAVVNTILDKHDKATAERKFNALMATGSINEAIAYYHLFKESQAARQADDPTFRPLNIACVFSPPAEGNKDVQQLQEDLPQEKADNLIDPEGKKTALRSIMADYNAQYGTNHSIGEFDQYYQDVQTRIKSQKFPLSDVPHAEKIDITIVVDMLLTGFDSQYLNTLYVDKKLRYHGLIQAFSRTNRVLNDTKPYGNILDFRQQQEAVNEAIKLFSGEHANEAARTVWLVDPVPLVIERFRGAVDRLRDFMESQDLPCTPEAVANLKGDQARAGFIRLFKEVQRLKTQLDQYTDRTPEHDADIESILSADDLQAFRGVYLDTAHDMREKQDKPDADTSEQVQVLDFELVLFASTLIDYDYIMSLIADYTSQTPDQMKLTRKQLVGLIASDAKFMDERETIAAYIDTLSAGEALDEQAIREGYLAFRDQTRQRQIDDLADHHGLEAALLRKLIQTVLQRSRFDEEDLRKLLEPLELGWKARSRKEVEVMTDLAPLLHHLADGQEIHGLEVYEG